MNFIKTKENFIELFLSHSESFLGVRYRLFLVELLFNSPIVIEVGSELSKKIICELDSHSKLFSIERDSHSVSVS